MEIFVPLAPLDKCYVTYILSSAQVQRLCVHAILLFSQIQQIQFFFFFTVHMWNVSLYPHPLISSMERQQVNHLVPKFVLQAVCVLRLGADLIGDLCFLWGG